MGPQIPASFLDPQSMKLLITKQGKKKDLLPLAYDKQLDLAWSLTWRTRVWRLRVLTRLEYCVLSLPLKNTDMSLCFAWGLSLKLYKIIHLCLASSWSYKYFSGTVTEKPGGYPNSQPSLERCWHLPELFLGLEMNFGFVVKPECRSTQCCRRDSNKTPCLVLFIIL